MAYLIDQYEIDVELVDYINHHALMIDMQANPIAIFSDSLSLLYANTALNNLLDSNESIVTIKLLNSFLNVSRLTSTLDNRGLAFVDRNLLCGTELVKFEFV